MCKVGLNASYKIACIYYLQTNIYKQRKKYTIYFNTLLQKGTTYMDVWLYILQKTTQVANSG